MFVWFRQPATARARNLWLAAALFCTAASTPSLAADPAGTVKTVSGKVSILRGSESLAAVPGVVVYPQDTLQTGADGAVGVTLKDDTLISCGPNSTVALAKYRFNPTTHVGELLISIVKGTLTMVSGLLVKHSHEQAAVKTPTTTIGVRGTEFAIEVD